MLHYVELFDTLELRQFRLVGQSMGGFIATKFAVEHGARVEKLVLVCPIGLPVPPGQPTVNFLAVPPEELPALLAHDPQTVIKHLPAGAPSAGVHRRARQGSDDGRPRARRRQAHVRREAAALPAPADDADAARLG